MKKWMRVLAVLLAVSLEWAALPSAAFAAGESPQVICGDEASGTVPEDIVQTARQNGTATVPEGKISEKGEGENAGEELPEDRTETVPQTASLEILSGPQKLRYYAGGRQRLDLNGMEIRITDLQGEAKNYKYGEGADEDPGRGDWWDIEEYFSYSDDTVEWSTPGTYTVTVSCFGTEASFQIELEETPVSDLAITKMPFKTTYYEYQIDDVDLTGMEYTITFKNGDHVSGTAEDRYVYFEYAGEEFRIQSEWKNPVDGETAAGDNALILSALGFQKELDAVIRIEKDPVESIDVVKNPVKQRYISLDERIDLYGMELAVVYMDGTKETISCQEHTDRLAVENSHGGTITADLGLSSDLIYVMTIKYENSWCEIGLPPLDLAAMEPTELEEEGRYHIALTEENPYRIYAFTPAETRTYHFFSENTRSCVDLYKENEMLASADGDVGDEEKFCLSYELQSGSTYYYIVRQFNRTEEMDCYFSAQTSSLEDLQVKDLEITKPENCTWYDFEADKTIRAEELALWDTECKIIYANGWERTIKAWDDDRLNVATIHGEELSIEWEYTYTDEINDRLVDKTKENALIYTYGEKTWKFPVVFDAPTPVESLTIVKNPWEGKVLYDYQASGMEAGEIDPDGLTVKIRYNDGRAEETVVWDGEDGYDLSRYHNGYEMRIRLKESGDGQEDAEKTLVLAYMGKESEIPVKISEDPVSAIEILQKPEKTEYYPFEDLGDLYGLKAKITYKDNTEQTVEVKEHVKKYPVQGPYGSKISMVTGFYHFDGGSTRIVSLFYMGTTEFLMPYVDRPFTQEESVSLIEGKEEPATLKGEQDHKIFSFVPSAPGYYIFTYGGKEGDPACSARLYSDKGKELDSAWYGEDLEHPMSGGKPYYIVLKGEEEAVAEQTFACSIRKQEEIPAEEIEEVVLEINKPYPGRELPGEENIDSEKYHVESYQWLNDKGGNLIADHGTAYELKLVLAPYAPYFFTASTQAEVSYVDGKAVTSLGDDGKLTIHYTFPYTWCKITMPKVEGYKLDAECYEQDGHWIGRAEYKGSYRFSYQKEEGGGEGALILEAGGVVLTPDKDGVYTIKDITKNVEVKTHMGKLQQKIQASNMTKTYGDKDFKVTASTNGDGGLTFESKNPKVIKIGSGKAQIVGAGTARILIRAEETAVYSEASKEIKITVKKAAISIPKTAHKKVYGDKAFGLNASAKDSLSYTSTDSKVASVDKKGKVTVKACGTAKIKISTPSGNHNAVTVTVKVVPKKTTIQKATSKKAGQLTVNWKQQKEALGYRVEYTLDKKFKKGVSSVDIDKNKTTSTVIKKNLKKGKKYYVRIKAYTKIDGRKEYGNVSKVLYTAIKKK